MPRKATPERLEKAALHYLERYASSAANLRRVLMRRVERSARAHGTDRDEGAHAVDAIVVRLQAAGILDDAAYAGMRARSLFRRGASQRAIRYQLAQKGIPEELIAAALETLAEEATDPDRAAAARYAQRRRLGPWRTARRAEHRERDLAALGRQGFAWETARRVIDAATPEEAEGDG